MKNNIKVSSVVVRIHGEGESCLEVEFVENKEDDVFRLESLTSYNGWKREDNLDASNMAKDYLRRKGMQVK
jgi:hypothetical protein